MATRGSSTQKDLLDNFSHSGTGSEEQMVSNSSPPKRSPAAGSFCIDLATHFALITYRRAASEPGQLGSPALTARQRTRRRTAKIGPKPIPTVVSHAYTRRTACRHLLVSCMGGRQLRGQADENNTCTTVEDELSFGAFEPWADRTGEKGDGHAVSQV